MNILTQKAVDVHFLTEGWMCSLMPRAGDVHIPTQRAENLHIVIQRPSDVHIATQRAGDVHIMTQRTWVGTFRQRWLGWEHFDVEVWGWAHYDAKG